MSASPDAPRKLRDQSGGSGAAWSASLRAVPEPELAAWLALLAAGAAEAMIEVDLSAWDVAAPFLLVEEAGGRVTDFEGRRALDSGTFLATNGLLHDEIRRRLLSRT